MGYLKKSVEGVFWVGGFRLASRGIAFGRIAILARLLTPSQFGVFGVASLILSLLERFTSTGINIFLIQNNRKLSEYLNTAYVISIVRGLLISLVILLTAPAVSSFFNSPESERLLNIIALVAFVRGFINPSRVRFQKLLKFDKEFIFGGAILASDVAATIIVAYYTRSAESLVWGLFAGAFVEVILSHALIKPRPKFAYQLSQVKEIISQGKWITGSRIFQYFFHEGDDMVVGKLLNTTSLGFYQMAYKISTLPITEISDVIGKVAFPIFTNFSSDKKRLKRALFITFIMASLAIAPFGAIIYFFTEEIVLILLGGQWLEIVPTLRLLSLFGVIEALTGLFVPVFLSTNNQKYQTIVTLVGMIGMFIFILPLTLELGIYGAGLSALIGSLIAVPLNLYFVFKILR